MANWSAVKESRRRLARIRCVKDCINQFKDTRPLPACMCYVADELTYATTKDVKTFIYSQPDTKSSVITELKVVPADRITLTGEELCNSHGQWARIIKIVKAPRGAGTSTATEDINFDQEAWLLLYNIKLATDDSPAFLSMHKMSQIDKSEKKKPVAPPVIWMDAVEHTYSIGTKKASFPASNAKASAALQEIDVNWNLEHDEELAHFLCSHIETQNDNLGSIKNYVDSIEVSSFSDDEASENLTDGDPDTFWESDGNQGLHWIRLKMKKGTVIKKLSVVVDASDDNYMPYRIVTSGGEADKLSQLSDITVDETLHGVNDILLIENQTEHHSTIEIAIKECKDDGIDTRIHGIKIKSTKERDLGLNFDLFTPQNLVRYPKLENFNTSMLYHRAQLLQRFMRLLDSVLSYIVPSWEYSVGSYSSLEVIRQFLPLSNKRMSLIETFLRESESCRPNSMPKLYINRRAAADHKDDPSLDPDCKNTIFIQIYEGLKPRDRFNDRPLDYRWPTRYDQWWECKFLAEGIIDQGGGFRDSLSDLAEEICPTPTDVPVPLPLFVRAPNQSNQDMNVNRDVYVPRPSCMEMSKYRWLGQLMGSCLRGKESLVLTLPPFVWKRLAGERVTWARDFATVDEAEVKMMEHMERMSEEDFHAYFSQDERTWSTMLSGGEVVSLRDDESADQPVQYADRLEYARLVQEARMHEADKQIGALREGLLSVIPQAVLDLLSWQELERKVCGDPEVSVAALKRSAHYEDVDEDETRVKYLWEALGNFSNEDRSRFLRFVTGRRRLPAPLYLCPDKGDVMDGLPESSTCSNTLYLPSYSSAKVAEEKLRYAAYNCIAIDTDMSPWDE